MTDEEMTMIMQEITMNIPKEQSKMIRSIEASLVWDILTSQIEQIKAQGMEVEIPFETPTVDVLDPSLIVEDVE